MTKLTNRQLIPGIGKLTPDVRYLLQQFYTVDLSRVPIIIEAQPKDDNVSNGVTRPDGIHFWADVWEDWWGPNLLALIAHELHHWEWVHTHWLGWTRWWFSAQVLGSRSFEDAAEEKQRFVKVALDDRDMQVLDRET